MGTDETGAVSGIDNLRKIQGEFWDNHIPTLKARKRWIRSTGAGPGTASREFLLERVYDGESFLDVGCGPGVVYECFQLANRQIEYRGIDVSPGFVEACRDLFPEGDFREGNAMQLSAADNSYDVVNLSNVIEHTPGYEIPIKEAMRVARRRVIITMWRPLIIGKPDRRQVPEKGSNDYNRDIFLHYLSSFNVPIEYTVRSHPKRDYFIWVLYKNMNDCVFDLDDLCECEYAVDKDLLFELKDLYPDLKVTLFAIPNRGSREFFLEWAAHDWIELAVHGWSHSPKDECLHWTYSETCRYLDMAEQMDCGFVRGFRPPGWKISAEALQALKDRGYWVAKLKGEQTDWEYPAQGNLLCIHGHLRNSRHKNHSMRNGIRQLMARGLPWDEKTRFRFISEVMSENN
jgi:SAM-dependent methyltransferase